MLNVATIGALSPTLSYLHETATQLGIELQYNLFLSVPPNPLPPTPNALPPSTTISPYRPEVAQLVREGLPLVRGEGGSSGGMAVIACGPEGIVMEARNAVAGLGVMERVKCGGVEFHGECYAL